MSRTALIWKAPVHAGGDKRWNSVQVTASLLTCISIPHDRDSLPNGPCRRGPLLCFLHYRASIPITLGWVSGIPPQHPDPLLGQQGPRQAGLKSMPEHSQGQRCSAAHVPFARNSLLPRAHQWSSQGSQKRIYDMIVCLVCSTGCRKMLLTACLHANNATTRNVLDFEH